MIGERWMWLGVGLVLFGAALLVLAARRARRAKRFRVAARRAAYRQGSASAGTLYGSPRRDPGETAVMPRVPGGDGRG